MATTHPECGHPVQVEEIGGRSMALPCATCSTSPDLKVPLPEPEGLARAMEHPARPKLAVVRFVKVGPPAALQWGMAE